MKEKYETMDVQALRELDKQATEGPWICEMVSNDDASWVIGTAVDAHDNPVAGVVEREHSEFITPIYAIAESTNPSRQDGQLICAMRNALPELLERVAFLERGIQPSTAPIYSVSAEQLVNIAEPKRRSDRLLAVEEIIRGDK